MRSQPSLKAVRKCIPESLLILFFAIMMIKRINRFKAQHAFLLEHQEWVKRLKFEDIPSRTPLSRRYKHLTATVKKFVEYIGDFGIALDTETPIEVIFEDKSFYKAQGPVWHQKDRKAAHIPEGLRNLTVNCPKHGKVRYTATTDLGKEVVPMYCPRCEDEARKQYQHIESLDPIQISVVDSL